MDTPNKNAMKNFITHALKSGIHFLYEKLIEPRSVKEHTQRREFILNCILVGFICITIALDLSMVYNKLTLGQEYIGVPIGISSIVTCIYIIFLFISRIGHSKVSSYFLIIFSLALTTVGQIYWGMSMPSGLLADAFIISLATILIHSRLGLLLSIIIGGILTFLSYRESVAGNISAWKLSAVNISTGLQYSIILFLITIVSWLYAREITKSLARAQSSEAMLKMRNESLEVLVEERTRELKTAQIEKMSQLYRFVEFGRLSSGVFHDLLNPLTAVISHIQLIQDSNRSDIPEIKDSVDRAISASRRMEQFISTITKQVQNHHLSVPFSVNNEIEEVILLFSYKSKKENVLIDLIAEENCTVTGNPLKFHQIVANLVSNALDSYQYCTDKQPRSMQEKVIHIKVINLNDFVAIKVKDYGCGATAEVIEKMFDPFFSTKSDDKGIGLGLSTTKYLVERDFKGTISVKSIPGSGSVFTVTIPKLIDITDGQGETSSILV